MSIQRILNKRLSPRWNYLIWIILIIKLIIPFGPKSDISIFNKVDILNISQDRYIEETMKDINQSQGTNNIIEQKIPIQENASNQFTDNKENINYTKYIAMIWIAIAINIFIFIIITFVLLNINLRKSSIDANERINSILIKAKEEINVKINIKLVVSRYISTPALTGVIVPKILIPYNMIDFTEKELEYIFLHELSHYKRKDILINYILIALQCIHWFNPFIWFFFKNIKEAMELATDEKVLHILEDKEHKEYGLALLNVISKVNNSVFYPRLVSMANDKKKIEKRIRNIKYINYIKKKKAIFSIIGMIVLIVLVPTMLTSKLSNFSKLQNGYIKIVKLLEKQENIGVDNIYEIVPNVEFINSNGQALRLDKTLNDSRYNAIECTIKDETFLLAYDEKLEIREVHYFKKIDTGISNIHFKYINLDELKGLYEVRIGVNCIDAKHKVISNLYKDIEIMESYKLYRAIANRLESGKSIGMEELISIDKKISKFEVDKNLYIQSDKLYSGEGKNKLEIDYNNKSDTVYNIELRRDNQILKFKSPLPLEDEYKYNPNELGYIWIVDKGIDNQEKLLSNLMKIDMESIKTPNIEVDNNTIEELNNKDNNVGMISREDISYSSEIEPKLLTMKESLEYVRNNTEQNIKEINRSYEDEVGVTEVTYNSANEKYVVRYMHPYKITDEGVEDGYDLSKTAGIWIYQSAFDIS